MIKLAQTTSSNPLPSHIRHVLGASPNHLLVLPGLLTSAHESKKITRLMAEAKSRNWSALSLDYFGCFSNHGHIWSGIHQPVPHSSACDISWIRWQKDIVDALDRVGWLHQQQPVPDLQRLNHKLTIVGCSAGFALALDVFCERGRSLARRFTAGIHLIGVGASPDPRSRWRKDGVLDGHWIWVPSPYANHSRGYPLPIGLVTEASPVAAECVIPGGGGGGGQTDPLRVTLIHGDADEVIALERAMVELPAAISAATEAVVDVSWQVIPNGDHRLSRETELEAIVNEVFGAGGGKLGMRE